MKEAILLNSLLRYLRESGNSSFDSVQCSIKEGVVISLKNSGNVKYSSSVIYRNRLIVGDSEFGSVGSCFKSYISYLAKHDNCMLQIQEGVDEVTGDIVFISVKAIKYNIDSIMLELTRELDKYNSILGVSSVFVCDLYEKHIDAYPLSLNISGVEEEVIIEVTEYGVNLDKLYKKVPKLKNKIFTSLFECIWKLNGDYSIVVKLVKNSKNYVPVMYTIVFDSSVKSLNIC